MTGPMNASEERILPPLASERPISLPRRRWRIAWLLGIGVLVNYFDRVNLSVSHDALIGTFGISDVIFGYLSSAYNVTYCLLQLPIGVILDKFGVRRVGRIGTFLWSCATFAAAGAPTLGGLFGARFLLGVGEAPTFPASAKAIGEWFPPKERSFATALFDSAAKFASVPGVPLLGFVLLRFGWRWSFALTGLISVAYFAYFWRVYRDPDDDRGLSAAEREYIQGAAKAAEAPARPEGSSIPLFRLVRQRKVIGVFLGFGAYNYVFYLLLTWLPTYLSEALHISLMHSFLYTSVPWILSTFTDLAVGGWLVDYVIRRGGNADRIRRTILIIGTAFGLGIFGAVHAHSAAHALFWISMSMGGLSAAAPILWSSPSLIATRANVGKVGGIMNFSGQVSGIAAPIITGYVVELRHSYALAFIVPAIYLLIGIAGYVFLLGRIEVPKEAAA